MRNTNKTVTIYRKKWDEENACDVYHGTVIKGVSFFSRISTAVSTEGLAHACEGTLRIPMEVYPEGLELKNGDLVCEGALETKVAMLSELDVLCPYVYTVVGITNNVSVMGSHVKVVCK